jgi:choline dehydrogenase
MAQLRVPFDDRDYTGFLCIFDKDGTLIDFHFMWATWIRDLARRLGEAAGRDVAASLFRLAGFDDATGRVDPSGALAIGTMADLRVLGAEALREAGLTDDAATAAIATAWTIPDPVALARPLADLPALFGALRQRGMHIAVATTDDRAPTQATLQAFGVAHMVDALACGDDGHALKPAPDAVLKLCRELGTEPARAAVVGDTAADMRMGRVAGAGLTIGVLSGVGTAEVLEPNAAAVLGSIAELI